MLPFSGPLCAPSTLASMQDEWWMWTKVLAKAMKKLLHVENGDNNIYAKNEHYSYLLNGVVSKNMTTGTLKDNRYRK